MKAYYDITQGTEEWHNIRYGKIGGTLSKGLFVKSDTLLYDVLSELVEPYQYEEDYTSADMERGYQYEPIARNELSQYIGIELKECGWLQCEEVPLLGISPDGISEDETISAEIKCPASKKHTKTIVEDAIPQDNINQCLHYFTVNPKLEKHYFCSFRPENKYKPLFVKMLTRDSEVNLGTKAKPVIKPIHEWVKLAKENAITLQCEINLIIEKLSF